MEAVDKHDCWPITYREDRLQKGVEEDECRTKMKSLSCDSRSGWMFGTSTTSTLRLSVAGLNPYMYLFTMSATRLRHFSDVYRRERDVEQAEGIQRAARR